MEVASEFENVLNNLKDIDMESLNISDSIKLDFYKYYKQATVGDCNIQEPYSIFYKAHAKWKAWNSIKGMSMDDVWLHISNDLF